MSDATTEVKNAATTVTTPLETPEQEDTTSFAERYSDVLGKVNDTLDQVDWSQMVLCFERLSTASWSSRNPVAAVRAALGSFVLQTVLCPAR